jgi:hypothetical protein
MFSDIDQYMQFDHTIFVGVIVIFDLEYFIKKNLGSGKSLVFCLGSNPQSITLKASMLTNTPEKKSPPTKIVSTHFVSSIHDPTL